jgi:AcrR family transcriptional regulator
VEAGAEQRERIRAAIVELTFERGVVGLSITDVCGRAGVGPAEFDLHYADLEDCFCQTLQEQTDELLVRVAAKFVPELPWRERLRAVAYEMLRFLREEPRRARMMTVEVLFAGPRAQLIRDRGMQALIELIDQGRAEPAAPDSLTRFTAETLGSAVYQRMKEAIEPGEYERLDELLPDLMYATVLPYLGPEAALEELHRRPPGSAGD